MQRESGKERGSRRTALTAMAGVLLVAVGAAVLLFRYDFYPVGTTVMDPAAARGDKVLVAPLNDGETPKLGEVVVVDSGGWSDEAAGAEYILRVGGLGGDTVSCCDAQGRVELNGKVDEPSTVSGNAPGAPGFTVTVPAGHVFLLGDRRDVARDSRAHLSSAQGGVPLSAVKGRVVASLLPPGSVEGTDSISVNPFSPFGTWVYAVAALLVGALCLLRVIVSAVRVASHRRRGTPSAVVAGDSRDRDP